MKEKDYVIESDNGVWHYIDNTVRGLFTDEEINKINEEDLSRQNKAIEQILADGFVPISIFVRDHEYNLVEKTAYVHPDFEPSTSEGFYEKHGVHYNIYIPSYKRAKETKTVKMLKVHGIENYYLAIDPDQYESYKQYHNPRNLVIRDFTFREDHIVDLVSSVKSPYRMRGHSPLVNFLLSFSQAMGEEKYWTMDDDILHMGMKAHKGDSPAVADLPYDKNNYYRCSHIKPEFGFSMSKFLSSLEVIGQHSRNHGFIGLEKFGLVFQLPIIWKLGTRVYTMYLSDNKNQPKHFGQHNNDVITSLEQSKRGFVNMLFEGICYHSEGTQVGDGGQVEVYKTFGTFDKGKVLVRAQPNFAKISVNYNRIHHSVDYTKYNQQRLVGAVKR